MSSTPHGARLRVASALRADLRLQWRYGITPAVAFVSVAWVVLLRVVPGDALRLAIPAVLFSDLAVIGLFFLPGLLLFEKNEHTLAALVVSPLRFVEYLTAKVVAFTLLALAVAAVLVIGAVAGRDEVAVSALPLLSGVLLLSVHASLAAYAATARCMTITDALVRVLWTIPLALPLVALFHVVETPLLWLVPTTAPLELLAAATTPASPWRTAGTTAVALAWVGPLFLLARQQHDRYVLRRGAPAMASRPLSSPRLAAPRSPLAAFALADVRNLRREPLLVMMALTPILLVAVARAAAALGAAPLQAASVGRSVFEPLLLAFLIVLTVPFLLGALAGLMVLDERDQHVLATLRVTPLSLRGYLTYRVGVTAAFSTVALLVAVPASGLVEVARLPAMLPGLVVAGAEALLPALLLAAFAANKVEGLALLKAAGLPLFAPLAAWFVDPRWVWLLAPIPTLWPVLAVWRGLAGEPVVAVAAVGGLHVALITLWLLRRVRTSLGRTGS